MNLLVLSESLWPIGSGGELATYLYAKYLREEGINVKVIVRDDVRCPEWGDLECYDIKGFGVGKYCCLYPTSKRLTEKLFKWSDIVYFTGLFHLIPLARAMGKPTVVHLHSYFPSCPIGSLHTLRRNFVCKPDSRKCTGCIWYFERVHLRPSRYALASVLLNSSIGKVFPHLLKYVDALVFVSNAQKNLFLKHCPSIVRSYVNYNPLPNLTYVPVEGDDIGYFGGLSPLKGFDTLLKAWLRIHRKHQARICATKMGALAGLKSLDEAGISTHQILDKGLFDDIYRRIRCVVFPSIWEEPLPYVVSEALLRGRLLVASRVGGVPEMLDDLDGFFMVEPNDVNALSDALDSVLSMSRETVVELGMKNREGMLRKFNNQKSVNELIKVFEGTFGFVGQPSYPTHSSPYVAS